MSWTASAGSNAANPMSSSPDGVLRPAAELPLRLPHRDLQTRLRLELLEIRLARAVGIGLGEGELGVDVEQRRRGGRARGEAVEEAGDPLRPEVELGVDAADQVGRGLEAERGAGEGALLPLVHPDQVDGAAVAQGIAGGHPEDGGRCHREDAPLLEAGGDLRRALAEEQVGIDERDLSDLVGDAVVHVALQLPATHEELLAPLADLQRVEAQRRAVAAARRVVAQPERELGRRAFGQQEIHRCPVERIGDLGRAEPGGIGERLQVREHDVPVAHHLRRLGVARARPEPVLPIEERGVAPIGQAELLQVGLRGPGDRPLGPVERDPHLERDGIRDRSRPPGTRSASRAGTTAGPGSAAARRSAPARRSSRALIDLRERCRPSRPPRSGS